MIKKYFRDVKIGFLFSIGLGLMFFLLFNGINVINKYKLQSEMEEKSKYSFREIVELYPDGSKEFDKETYYNECLDISKEFVGNTIVYAGFFSYGKTSQGGGGICVYTLNEDMFLESKDGEYMVIDSLESDSARGAYIHEYLVTDAEQIDGKDMILAEGNYYEILGYIKDYTVDCSECDIYMFWNNMSEDARWKLYNGNRHMLEEGLSLEFFSNNPKAEESFNKLIKKYNDKGIRVELPLREEEYLEPEYNEYVTTTLNITGILLAFSCFNCIYISNLWICRRKKEMVVRRAFGYRIMDIIKELIIDLLKIVFVSMITAAGMNFVYIKFVLKESYVFDLSLDNIIILAGAIIISLIVSLIVPVIQVILIKPAKGIKC